MESIEAIALLLGQAPPPASGGEPVRQILLWVVILAVAVLVLGGVLITMRKRLDASDEAGEAGLPFTLGDLRQMHAEGRLSDDEFERTRQQIIDAARRGIDATAGEPENDASTPADDDSAEDPADNDQADGGDEPDRA